MPDEYSPSATYHTFTIALSWHILHFIRQSFLFRSELRFHSDKSKSWITQNQVFRIKFFAHFKAAFPHGQETQAYKTIQGYLCYIVEKVQNCVRICIYSNERSLRIVNSQHHNQGNYRSAKFCSEWVIRIWTHAHMHRLWSLSSFLHMAWKGKYRICCKRPISWTQRYL